MFRLFTKIKTCKLALVEWSRNTFGNSKTLLQDKHRLLAELTSMNDVDNLVAIRDLKAEINTLLYQDELSWRQCSRSIWLSAGYKNMKFFHERASQRRWKNHIPGVTNAAGSWCISENGIAVIAENYYKDLFTSAHPNHLETVLDSVDSLITPDMNDALLQRYTPNEVWRALFQMHPLKSPRLDGMYPFIFQKFWNIVGSDVTEAVQSVLHSGHMLGKMNYTNIILVPKTKWPTVGVWLPPN